MVGWIGFRPAGFLSSIKPSIPVYCFPGRLNQVVVNISCACARVCGNILYPGIITPEAGGVGRGCGAGRLAGRLGTGHVADIGQVEGPPFQPRPGNTHLFIQDAGLPGQEQAKGQQGGEHYEGEIGSFLAAHICILMGEGARLAASQDLFHRHPAEVNGFRPAWRGVNVLQIQVTVQAHHVPGVDDAAVAQ